MNDQTGAALREALDDEYKARATYRRVIESFGRVQPFVNILASEERHVAALLSLFDAFGLEPPADDWQDRIRIPPSLAAACEVAVAAEIENAEMYGRLLPMVDEPAVRDVLLRLSSASQERHLPAFRRCVERERSGGPSPRRRRRGNAA